VNCPYRFRLLHSLAEYSAQTRARTNPRNTVLGKIFMIVPGTDKLQRENTYVLKKYRYTLGCMGALLFCVLISWPLAPIGICDDWANIWMAKHIAETGHLLYNGWVTAILGLQLYWGALFIKLFGFSFTAARASILVLSLICAAFIHRILVRLGSGESTAAIAALALVLSPLFLPLTFMFMTDMTGMLSIVVCLYCCIRTLEDRSSWWLAAATLSSLLGGSVRQVAWVGVLVMVPSAAWLLRRQRRIVYTGAALWLLGCITIELTMRWFHAQPYIVVEPLFYNYDHISVLNVIQTSITALMCLSPMLLAFVPGRYRSAGLGGVLGALFFVWTQRSHGYANNLKQLPFGFEGNFIQAKGIYFHPILGSAPVVIGKWPRIALVIIAFAALASFASYAATTTKRADDPELSNKELTVLLLPFSIAYFFLIATRLFLYDRYFLPLEFIAVIMLLRIYKPARLPKLCTVAIVVFAAWGIANMHDLFSFERARAEAAQTAVDAGLPRTSIEGGFEYDGWTELEQTGYVNVKNMNGMGKNYKPWSPSAAEGCYDWFRPSSPSVKPSFHISYDPGVCFSLSKFAPIPYKTWIPIRTNYLYLLDSR
jgi:Dolichyl-phosphate-mannose-protein mannosyltransferase